MAPAWEFSDDLFAIVGKDGLLRAVNSAWERTLGWAADELVGRSPIEFSHAEDPSELLQVRRSAYLEGRVEDLEMRYRHRDGSDRWLRWSGYCDQDLWYVVGKDVTPARE
ncbi:MAG: hypothetical protein QOI20_3366, partial [Acidimicrobiaceae bacterium]|nr:hypothetical protein [Acidimicrobiaceae bacterium]